MFSGRLTSAIAQSRIQRISTLSSRGAGAARFSTLPDTTKTASGAEEKQTDTTTASASKIKATPAAGYRMPRVKKGEQILQFRPSGHTNLTSPTANFNFNLARDNHEKLKTKVVIGLVLLSLVGFGMFIKNAETNFRKAEIKKFAEKRRRRLDSEHGIDRDEQMKHFEELDKIYRISEKQEIAKYLEIGKTPKEYFKEQAERGFPKDEGNDGQASQQSSSTKALKETLMQKSDDGVEVSHIKGGDYEQVKVATATANGAVPDPRVAGPSIYFDTRMDSVNEQSSGRSDPLLQAMGERQKRAGSINPTESPDFMKPKQENAPSLRGGVKNEALYVPSQEASNLADLSPQERFLHETVERYNIVNAFLNKLSSPESRQFAQYLIIKLLPGVDTNEIAELDSLLAFVERATDSNSSLKGPFIDEYKPINDYLESLEEKQAQEFAAYMAPRLLGSSTDSREMENVVDFLKLHVAKAGSRPLVVRDVGSKDDVLGIFEMQNVQAMLENQHSTTAQVDEKVSELQSFDEQIPFLQTQVDTLEELQRQLREVKGRESKLDQKLLAKYLENAKTQISSIEHSLDRGIVGLPQSSIAYPEIPKRQVQDPVLQTTPYTEQIESLEKFFEDVKESDIAKRGIKDFAEGTVRDKVLPRHLNEMRQLNSVQVQKESQIAQNLELVRARMQDAELSKTQFLDGESAYQRLLHAKELDSLVNIEHSARPDSQIKLNPSMYEAYLREIVESGGTPSVQELSKKAAELSGLDLEVSLLKKAFNTSTEAVSRMINSPQNETSQTVVSVVEQDPRKETLVEIQNSLRKGQLAAAWKNIDKLLAQMTGDAKAESTEERLRELRFLVETHVFAGHFNSKLIDQLRGDYVRHLSFGENKRPPQRRFVPYSSTL